MQIDSVRRYVYSRRQENTLVIILTYLCDGVTITDYFHVLPASLAQQLAA